MRLVEHSAKLVNFPNNAEKLIEKMGRTCYASERGITPTSHVAFIKSLINPKGGGSSHSSVFEHVNITLDIVTDLAVSHQFIRHRHTKEHVAFSQQSTRYCNFSLDKFNGEITVIRPLKFLAGSTAFETWLQMCIHAEKAYFFLLKNDYKPEDAATVLPRSLATSFGVTTNCAQWRHYLPERLSPRAFSHHRHLAGLIRDELSKVCPNVFADFKKEIIGA